MKKYLSILLVTSLILVCVGGIVTAEDVKIITWMHWYDEPVEVLEAFHNAQDTIKVKWERIPASNYHQTLTMRIAAGESPDMYVPYYPDTYKQQIKEKALVDLTNEDFWSAYDPFAIKQNEINGRVYGLPLETMVNGMFYNKEILDSYGLDYPESWDDFMEVCAVLKENGVTPMVQGMAEGWQVKFAGLNPMAAMRYRDDEWVNKMLAGEVKWTDPEVVAQFQKKDDFFRKGYMHENAISMTLQQAWQVFVQGDAAFISGLSAYVNNVFQELRPEFEWGIGPIPVNDRGTPMKVEYFASHHTLVLNANSANRDASVQFVRWLAAEENMQLWGEVVKLFTSLKDTSFDFDPALEQFRGMFDYDRYGYEREPAAIANTFITTGQEQFLGTKTPEQVAKELQRDTDLSYAF